MNDAPCILLVDNGSLRAGSTLSLRRIASALTEEIGVDVNPVSLLHSDNIDPELLNGESAQIVEPFIQIVRATRGMNSFLIIPLFFGPSAAIDEYLPQRVAKLRAGGWDDLEIRIAPCMVDLEDAKNTDVAEMLADLVRRKITETNLFKPAVTLVDHGTPCVAVNQARNLVADQLKTILADEVAVVAASSMERREGKAYDFNEPLLENLLGSPRFEKEVVLAMLFTSSGRHAGPDGDIAEICADCENTHKGLTAYATDLFGTHPKLTKLLAKRFRAGLKSEPIQE